VRSQGTFLKVFSKVKYFERSTVNPS